MALKSSVSSPGTVHVPVLFEAVLSAFQPIKGKIFIDATLGGGGHTQGLLKAGAAQVIGLDWDVAALARCAPLVEKAKGKLIPVHTPYSAIADVAAQYAPDGVDGILIDAGLSSDQLDDPARGLSYHTDGPLDMRLNSTARTTAADLLATAREEELARIFFDYGEESRSRVLARAIVHARKSRMLLTTYDLLAVIEEVYPPRLGLKRAHPAARLFQALRVAVNDELGVLETALPAAARSLKVGGKLAVISFQPLEERLIKTTFRALCVDELDSVGRVVVSSPYKAHPKRMADAAELAINPRSRSAILRVLERVK